MDIVEFIHQLGYKQQDEMAKHFSENLVVYYLLKGIDHLLEGVKVRKRKDQIQYVVSKPVETELSQYNMYMHNTKYTIKTRKEKNDTIIEAHPYK